MDAPLCGGKAHLVSGGNLAHLHAVDVPAHEQRTVLEAETFNQSRQPSEGFARVQVGVQGNNSVKIWRQDHDRAKPLAADLIPRHAQADPHDEVPERRRPAQLPQPLKEPQEHFLSEVVRLGRGAKDTEERSSNQRCVSDADLATRRRFSSDGAPDEDLVGPG